MNSFIRWSAVAAVLATFAAAPALADAPKLPMISGQVATPSALAKGEQYLSISKTLECADGVCTGLIKGRAKKQTLITNISCVSVVDSGQVAFGAATRTAFSPVALAVLPVTSRTTVGTTEYSVVSGPTQVVIGPSDEFIVGVEVIGGGGDIGPAICSLTGTMTKL